MCIYSICRLLFPNSSDTITIIITTVPAILTAEEDATVVTTVIAVFAATTKTEYSQTGTTATFLRSTYRLRQVVRHSSVSDRLTGEDRIPDSG